MEKGMKWGREIKFYRRVVTFSKKTLNLAISRRCFPGEGKEMCKNINAHAQ